MCFLLYKKSSFDERNVSKLLSSPDLLVGVDCRLMNNGKENDVLIL